MIFNNKKDEKLNCSGPTLSSRDIYVYFEICFDLVETVLISILKLEWYSLIDVSHLNIPKNVKKFLDLSLVPKVHGVYSGMRYILHRSFVGICSVVFMFWSHTNQPTNGQIDKVENIHTP